MKKKDITDRLYDAVVKYIEGKGGAVVVIGGVEIQRFPNEPKFNFRLAIRVTGKTPTLPPSVRQKGNMNKYFKETQEWADMYEDILERNKQILAERDRWKSLAGVLRQTLMETTLPRDSNDRPLKVLVREVLEKYDSATKEAR